MIEIINTKIEEVKIIQPKVFGDARGYFFESFSEKEIEEKLGNVKFVQDNESCSHFGVVRGLHFQKPPYAQDKLVRVAVGKVLDVAVDIRKGSPTYGKYVAEILSDENHRQLFIPKGFAHGFVTLSDKVIFQYKCSEYYHPESEDGIAWDDSEIGIDWKIDKDKVILSDKDKNRISLKNFHTPFCMNRYLVAYSTPFHGGIVHKIVELENNDVLNAEVFAKAVNIGYPQDIIAWSIIKE